MYDPHVVYGVIEPRKDRYISYDRIRSIDPNLNQYATGIVRGFACDYIYGCEVSLDDVVTNAKNNETEAVDRFAKKYNLGKPHHMTALSGEYEPCDAVSYDPDEDSENSEDKDGISNMTKISDKESENSEDRDGISGEALQLSSDGPASLEHGHHGTTMSDESEAPTNRKFQTQFARLGVAQDNAARIPGYAVDCEGTPKAKRPDAVLGLHHKSRPALQKWGDGRRLPLRQSNS